MNRCDCPDEWEEERIRLVLAGCRPRDRLLVELGFETGLRVSELVGLCVGDVCGPQGPATILRLGRGRLKGGRGEGRERVSSRTIPLNDRAQAAIQAAVPAGTAPERALFPSRERQGAAITRRQAIRIIRRLFLAAGCSPDKVWAPHSLRRRFLQRIYDATGDINLAREAIGHRWITTTQRYLGLREGAVHDAILQLGATGARPPRVERPRLLLLS